jgi:osmotically-inducible protein OsmY
MTLRRRFPHRIPSLLFAGLAAALLPPALAACSPVGAAVGAGAAVGLGATEERGLGQSVEDKVIWLEINRRWLARDAALFQRVDLQVHEGRVLLTGMVEAPETRIEAVRLAWQAEGVGEVINEIRIAEEPRSFSDYLQDGWLARQLEMKILLDERIRSINYSIDAVDSVIYLMGVAQDEAELQRVIDHARDIPYVRRVVSYVRLREDPTRGPQ